MNTKIPKLDVSNMLGFRLLQGSNALNAKVGGKAGEKFVQLGESLNAKTGSKAGVKPT